MTHDPCIFKLDSDLQSRFAENDEVFPGAQLGRVAQGPAVGLYLVVDGLVAVTIAPGLSDDLARFYSETWGQHRKGNPDILGLYGTWLNSLPKLRKVLYEPVSRSALQHFAATGTLPANPPPPPPPTRPTTVPGGTRPPGAAPVHGHLPFQDVTTAFDIFYRFEVVAEQPADHRRRDRDDRDRHVYLTVERAAFSTDGLFGGCT